MKKLRVIRTQLNFKNEKVIIKTPHKIESVQQYKKHLRGIYPLLINSLLTVEEYE